MATKNASEIASIDIQFVLTLNRKNQRILLIKNLTDLSILIFRIRKTEFVTLDTSSLLRFFNVVCTLSIKIRSQVRLNNF